VTLCHVKTESSLKVTRSVACIEVKFVDNEQRVNKILGFTICYYQLAEFHQILTCFLRVVGSV
jgi:hypothetical protein